MDHVLAHIKTRAKKRIFILRVQRGYWPTGQHLLSPRVVEFIQIPGIGNWIIRKAICGQR